MKTFCKVCGLRESDGFRVCIICFREEMRAQDELEEELEGIAFGNPKYTVLRPVWLSTP